MSEVLDQSDIDALLAAASGNAAAAPDAPAAPPPTSAAPNPGEPQPFERGPFMVRDDAVHYDFKRPERVSKEQIRALSSVHEVFARNFGAVLSGFLRTIVDVRVVGVEQLTYSEFIHSLPNPTCFATLVAPPLEGQMCLEISPLIVYPVIDRLLGGTNAGTYVPLRPLTSIEWRLISKVIDRALDLLSDVWKNLIEARFQVQDTESNPELVHIVAPTEVVLFITFEIKLSHVAGTMGLCIPYNTIETILSRLTTQAWFYKPKSATPAQQKKLYRNLVRGTIELTAFLGETKIKLSEFNSLQPGDILPLDKLATREFLVRAAGNNKFAGTLGSLRGNKAIRVTRAAQPDEPL